MLGQPVILGGSQEGSDDAVLGQLVQLQVIEGLPWANDGDVCAQALHSRDIITKALDSFLWRLALELTGLPLLELRRSLAWGGRASGDSGGRFNLRFGWLKIHAEWLQYSCAGDWLYRHLCEV